MSKKIGYAGDRHIAVKVLSFIKKHDIYPQILFISDNKESSHSEELISLCKDLPFENIIPGSKLSEERTIKKVKSLALDYIFCIHYPYLIPTSIIDCVNIGVINLHPAYLPYNRGWNTPTWSIIEKTPYGATLHFMDSKLDTGDIIAQEKIEILPEDTADSLYNRTLELEYELFKSSWPVLMTGKPERIRQDHNLATIHRKGDIKSIQKLELSEEKKIEDILDLLRGLTTNNLDEAAYYEKNDKRYFIQIKIFKEHII